MGVFDPSPFKISRCGLEGTAARHCANCRLEPRRVGVRDLADSVATANVQRLPNRESLERVPTTDRYFSYIATLLRASVTMLETNCRFPRAWGLRARQILKNSAIELPR